ncbi:MAG: hypothetical protein IPM53_17515 [Anaerolineaceae bacterium]|nr:hypothetical protein [Anaerolineaceae bacterium]
MITKGDTPVFNKHFFLLLMILLSGLVLGQRHFVAAETAVAETAAPETAAPLAVQAVIGSGTAASCQTNDAVNAFSNAVEAGGVVDFNCGPDPVVIFVNTSLVYQQVTVNGDGRITLSGEDLRQIFYVMGAGNLTLNDIELVDGSAGSGGALYIEPSSKATLNNTSIRSSGASSSGGAIYNWGTLTLNDSILDSNQAAQDGGGIFNEGGSVVTIYNTDFYDNHALRGGAVANAPASTVTINGSAMSSNQSTNDGGAVHNRGTLTATRATLGSNIAGVNGGGVFNNGGVVSLYSSYLVSNQSINGGGIYSVNGQLTVEGTAVRSSTTSNQGGGIFTASSTQISNGTFSNNRALKGGALFAIANVTILNATFNENRADLGGAIWREPSSTTTVKNSILAGSRNTNNSSPSLNCDGPTLTSLGRNIISDNSCVPNPGALGDLHGTDPELGQWLGSTLHGYIPADTSPAVDYGQDCPVVDQRGYPRPLGAACDVGSIERGTLVFVPLVIR